MNDLRYAIRQLARTPAFTIVAALTLAVGIGANTALFALVDAVFSRPLPGVHATERLVWITPYSSRYGRAMNLSYPDFREYRDSSGVFAEAAAYGRAVVSLAAGDQPVRVQGAIVDGAFFKLLGVRMARGRAFSTDESTVPNSYPVVVISYRMWQDRLGANESAVGRSIVLNGRPFTIIGVTPEGFNGVEHGQPIELFMPIMMQQAVMPQFGNMLENRGSWWLRAIGTLGPGTTLERAGAAVATIAARREREDSVNYANVTATVTPVTGGLSPSEGADIYPVAGIAVAATGLILLICCSNVSNMLLARAVGRRREIGVRLSLGASRGRVIRQLLTEAAMLSMLAATLGVVFALWATDLITKIIEAPLDISPNPDTLAFTVGIAIATGLVFGLVPALHATRGELATSLKDSAAGRDRGRSKLQSGFVVAQLSLSLVLLVTAGMFLSSLYRSMKRDLGFEATSHVLAASFDLGLQGYKPEQATNFVNEIERRVRGLPGVSDVTFTNNVPLGERSLGGELWFDAREAGSAQDVESSAEAHQYYVRPGFFKTLGIGIVRGRDFGATDLPTSEHVAIVSEDFARHAWPGVDPIGKHVSTQGPKGPFVPVVGVVRDAMTFRSERQRPTLYLAQSQYPQVSDFTILVRTSGDAATLARPLTTMIRTLDKNLPVVGAQTLARYRYDSLSESRVGSWILAIVGAVALSLACLGVYSVIAFSVGQRTREIGVRIALGAAGGQVTTMFVREGARLTAIGITVGLGLSLVLAKVLSSVFLGLAAADGLAFIGVAALLGGIAGIASWIPARRAATVDPMTALRAE